MSEVKNTISENIEKMKLMLPREANRIVRESSVKAADIARKETPSSGLSAGARMAQNRKKASNFSMSLKDSLVTSNTRGGGMNMNPRRKVYYTQNGAGWRAHFPDSGTVYQRSQGFIDTSRNKIDSEVQDFILEEVRRVVSDV